MRTVISLSLAFFLTNFHFWQTCFYPSENITSISPQISKFVPPSVNFSKDSLRYFSIRFNRVNTQIRDGKIDQKKAKKEVSKLLPIIKRYYFLSKNGTINNKKCFPVVGYNHMAIGGKNGNGYLPKGYNYYHGNKHLGHPAHDIFVYDTDQDNLDDKTKKPVQIAAVSDGLVIAAEPYWKVESKLRGGVYVLLYEPKAETLYYYAHNQEVFVKPGDLVKAGQVISTMGRTGLNAYKKRSPTHLHFMMLKVSPDGSLTPADSYQMLLKL